MKIKTFMDFIQHTLLHRAKLDLTTLKYLMQEFEKCLTKPELNRIKPQLLMILNYTSQQLTLNQSINKAKAKNLEKQLNNIKDSDNE